MWRQTGTDIVYGVAKTELLNSAVWGRKGLFGSCFRGILVHRSREGMAPGVYGGMRSSRSSRGRLLHAEWFRERRKQAGTGDV